MGQGSSRHQGKTPEARIVLDRIERSHPDKDSAMSAALLAALSMSLAILCWGSSFPLITIALSEIDPAPLAAIRFAVAAVAAALWLLWSRPRLPIGRDIFLFLLQSLVGIVIYSFAMHAGQQTVTAGAASFIVNTAPLMTMILAVLLLNDRFTPWGWVGASVGLLGVGLIGIGQPGGLAFGAGTSLILVAALCSATSFILQKPLVARYGALPTASLSLIVGSLLLSPWLPGGIAMLKVSTPQIISAVLVLGIFSAAVGFASWAYALGYYGPARAANFFYLVPLVATVLAYLMTGETPSTFTLIGGALVLTGVLLVNTIGRKRAK